MKRILTQMIFLGALLGVGCVGMPTPGDSNDGQNDPVPPSSASPPNNTMPSSPSEAPPGSSSPGEQSEPPIATRPGGGSGATPAGWRVGGVFDDICLASFTEDFERVGTETGEVIFSALADDTYPVSSYRMSDTGLSITLLYQLDEADDDVDRMNSEDGVFIAELGDTESAQWATLTVSGTDLDSLPLTVDCDLDAAERGTAALSTVTLYVDDALSEVACELPEGTTVGAEIELVRMTRSMDTDPVLFRVEMGPLAPECQAYETTYLTVTPYELDGQNIVAPSLTRVLLKP